MSQTLFSELNSAFQFLRNRTIDHNQNTVKAIYFSLLLQRGRMSHLLRTRLSVTQAIMFRAPCCFLSLCPRALCIAFWLTAV